MQPDHSRPLLYFARTLTYIQHTFSTFLQHYTTKSDFSDPSVQLPVRLRRFSSLFDVGQCRTVSDHVSLLFITILGHTDRAGIAFGLFSSAWTFLLIIALFYCFFTLLLCLHVYKMVDMIEMNNIQFSPIVSSILTLVNFEIAMFAIDLRLCDFATLRFRPSTLRLSTSRLFEPIHQETAKVALAVLGSL